MKALITAEINREYMEPLERLLEIEYAGWGKTREILSEDEMARLISGKDILVTSYDPITRRVMEASPNLRLIVCTRANPVNVDIGAAREKGIPVSYAPGRNTTCTAEFTVALMLSVMRKIPMAYAALKSGRHLAPAAAATPTAPAAQAATVDSAAHADPAASPNSAAPAAPAPETAATPAAAAPAAGLPAVAKTAEPGLRDDVTWALGPNSPYVLYKGFQMSGHTLGVVGYGGVGREVARICRSLGMKILAADPFIAPETLEAGDEQVGMDELLARADVVTLHCKDTPETRGVINRDAFEKMKSSAYFINTSRGALVDETALIEALRARKIAGAALDVFDSEPLPENHPFVAELDNIVITPHIAGATYDAIDHHTRQLARDVEHFLRGEPLEFEYR
ncbi:MAG: dihydrofolate reductase [Peptococcaceae bacterium]|jgi:D-3-phosphoglycerate dehydrogenase|nr:dihydrofolate reductase [Peptococcaceae bacterium]